MASRPEKKERRSRSPAPPNKAQLDELDDEAWLRMQRRIATTLEQRKSKGESGKVTAEAATANAPPRSEKKSEVKEERSDTDQPEADYGDQDELEDSHDDDEEHQRVQEQIRKDLQSEDGEEERYKRRECTLKSADLDRRLEDERDERRRTRSRSPRHEDWRGHWHSQSRERSHKGFGKGKEGRKGKGS
jgi:hypothetical protein